MATWYADAGVASSGDGTSWATAKKTLVEAAALVANGDTLNLRGTFRAPDYLTISGKSNVTIAGDGTCWIRGDRVLSGSWTDAGSGCWSKVIGSQTVGATLLGVVEDWDSRVDGQGRHYGHLVFVATTAEVQATDGRWAFITDTLYISPSDGSNPNTNGKTYAWCWSSDGEANGGNAVLLDQCIDCVVRNITTALVMRMDGAQGYGIRFADCRRCTAEDCTVWDYGYHGVGAAKAYADSCIFRRCTAWGGFSDGALIVNPFVFASTADSGGLGGSCTGEDLVWYAYPNLRYDGAVNVDWPATGVLFLQSHGGLNAGYTNRGTMENITWRRCKVYDKHPATSPCNIGYATAKHCRQPTDRSDPSTYRITIEDGYAQCRGPTIKGPVAVHRTILDGRTTTTILGSSGGILISDGDYTTVNGWEICEDGGGAVTGHQWYGACVVAAEVSASNGCIFKIETGPDASHKSIATMRLCTVYFTGTLVSGTSIGKTLSASTSQVDARGCVFARENTGTGANLFQGASTTPASIFNDLATNDNWYYNINSSRYCQNGSGSPACNDLTNWTANVDPDGVYDTNPQFNNAANLDLSPLAGGALATTKKVLTGMPAVGVNGLPYDGHYGAYQCGPLGANSLSLGLGLKIA